MAAFDPASPVNVLADRFWESLLELNPTLATTYGDERYADRLEDPGPEGRARTRALMERTLAEAEAIDPEGLSVEDRITRDILAVIAGIGIEEDDQQIHRLRVVDQIAGPQTLLAQVVQFQPADSPERLEKLVARIRGYGPFMAANTQIIRDGIATGLTAPRIVTERTIEQLDRLLAIPAEESPIVEMARVADEADRAAILDAVREVVYPADAEFARVLRDEYLAASRTEPGLWSAPNGTDLYRTQIRFWTTLEIAPEEVHQIGLEDLERIEAERREIARAAGFGDDTAAYRAALAAEPSNVPASRQELLDRANEDIARALAASPRFFGRLPRAGVEVRAVEPFKEKDSPFAYYFPPSADGSRSGIYYANTYDLPSRTFTTLASTTYHEAVPGHHFQIALEMENPDLNTFRRLGSRMAGGAYVEGWGLYSERLADEMGLYRTEGERFGMLDGQAWRAARLVVDSGMHGLRWSRQQSIDFLLKAGLTNTNAVIETDRYIVWPGQALTYKLGQIRIEKLRRELTARDGDRFDLREFHDQLLGHGSLPLATLERELPTWVRQPA
ncbi:MAG TPA: DUF885 domain-containing protein [Candidatus Limnocylindrales bacterium]|nr:DUF885 domain-containing protein [Candidatus Limnocylindrales bacterium]